MALRGVIQFLREDPVLGPACVGRSLRQLLTALHDTAAGAKPPMLFSGAIDQPGKSGRRTNLTFDILRGCIVSAVEGLIKAGMKNKEAGRFLESKLVEAKVKYKGKIIRADQILQWREQTGDTAPKASDNAFKKADAMTKAFLSSGSLERAKAIAEVHVKVAAIWNSN